MNAFDNLAIRVKIPLSFGLMLVIVVLLGALSLDRLSSVESNAEEVRNNWLPSAGQMSKLFTAIYNYRVREGRYLLMATEGTGSLDEGQADIDKATAELAAARKVYDGMITRGTQDEVLIQRFDQEWAGYVAVSRKMLGLAAGHDLKAATLLYNAESKEAFGRARKAIEDDNAFNVEEGKKAADNGAAIYGATKLLVYTALVVAAALCAVARLAAGPRRLDADPGGRTTARRTGAEGAARGADRGDQCRIRPRRRPRARRAGHGRGRAAQHFRQDVEQCRSRFETGRCGFGSGRRGLGQCPDRRIPPQRSCRPRSRKSRARWCSPRSSPGRP